MSRRSFGNLFASLVAILALGSGCSSNDPTVAENKSHEIKGVSSADQNARLSAQARARGAQVAPAPTR
jgi:hypothetical protein